MVNLPNHPQVIFVLSFFTLCLSSVCGALLRKGHDIEQMRENFSMILAATLTLLGLIIGFSFSMAINRYDQRNLYEEEEANAIGTEYIRAELLPTNDAERIHALLEKYVNQRILFYTTHDRQRLEQIETNTAQLQAELWSVIKESAESRPAPIIALVASGMNDVLNSQGYTQASWLNRLPIGSWCLLALIAICCSMLVGYGVKDIKSERILLPILPFVVSIAFFLIADIDSPRKGVINVKPQNLISLSKSLHVPVPE